MDRYQITFQTWNQLAGIYQDRFMDLELYNDTYDRFCALTDKQGARIFEVGCGPGNVTRYLKSHRPDFYIRATDVAPNMIALAKKNVPSVAFQLMDCRDIHAIKEHFDGIVCGFCMPYLSKEDCRKFINDCAMLLTPGGVLYCSAIEDDYSKSAYETSSDGKHTVFVYYHELHYLETFLRESGFEMPEVIRKHYEKADGTPSVHLILMARKK